MLSKSEEANGIFCKPSRTELNPLREEEEREEGKLVEEILEKCEANGVRMRATDLLRENKSDEDISKPMSEKRDER